MSSQQEPTAVAVARTHVGASGQSRLGQGAWRPGTGRACGRDERRPRRAEGRHDRDRRLHGWMRRRSRVLEIAQWGKSGRWLGWGPRPSLERLAIQINRYRARCHRCRSHSGGGSIVTLMAARDATADRAGSARPLECSLHAVRHASSVMRGTRRIVQVTPYCRKPRSLPEQRPSPDRPHALPVCS
jgi:hypothetical protein